MGNEANSVGSKTFSARRSPDFAFTIGQTSSNMNFYYGVLTLVVNLMGQQTWNWFRANGIKCESRRVAKVFFLAYGTTEPLPTIGTSTTTVVSTSSSAECQADFVVSKGGGHTLLRRGTAETLGFLHVGLPQANSVMWEHSEDGVRRRYRDLFTGTLSVFSKVIHR